MLNKNVVKMLIWEIGKGREESEKEYDRTVEYIQDTIDALKNIDQNIPDLKFNPVLLHKFGDLQWV